MKVKTGAFQPPDACSHIRLEAGWHAFRPGQERNASYNPVTCLDVIHAVCW